MLKGKTIIELKDVVTGEVEKYQDENMMMSAIQGLIQRGEVQLIVPWIYLLAIGVAMITVFLSLLRPMRIAAKVSEIEAMRYRGEQTAKRSRKGYSDITVPRLAAIHLAGNRKNNAVYTHFYYNKAPIFQAGECPQPYIYG